MKQKSIKPPLSAQLPSQASVFIFPALSGEDAWPKNNHFELFSSWRTFLSETNIRGTGLVLGVFNGPLPSWINGLPSLFY